MKKLVLFLIILVSIGAYTYFHKPKEVVAACKVDKDCATGQQCREIKETRQCVKINSPPPPASGAFSLYLGIKPKVNRDINNALSQSTNNLNDSLKEAEGK